ncbi:hypothetical protein ULG90_20625 [Halopseudomonas pachastrellae]|nr:hypothetical protein ULG90_20625 [Halopseudomonas pachastrellae]
MKIRVLLLCMAGIAPAMAMTPNNEPIQPILPAQITDPAKVELGKQLFF